MLSQWNEKEAAEFAADPVAMQAYVSRLLGKEPALVQHGGGNTSVKTAVVNIFGESEEILYVKGSGWDLATIKPEGFAPVKMELLLRLADLEKLSDSEMVREQRAAMINPSAPGPSVEAIMHALIPFKHVEHTHSDAVVTLTNTPSGASDARQVFGDAVLYVPYVMPGFILAKKIHELTRNFDWKKCEGMILLNHGIFTFHEDPKIAYENMIRLVTKAEKYLSQRGADKTRQAAANSSSVAPLEIAELRKSLAGQMNAPVLTRLNRNAEAIGFSNWDQAAEVAARGTVTPDHVIHIKPFPMIIKNDPSTSVAGFAAKYASYFERNQKPGLKKLDSCPRWAIWEGQGTLSISATATSLKVVDDIVAHTIKCLQWGEALGGWRPVTEADLFEVEYWELEQAKLKVGKTTSLPYQGKIALITGAASGIGKAIAEELQNLGAVVIALDLNPEVITLFKSKSSLGILCDVTDETSIQRALNQSVLYFGGIDILISNAGSFPPGQPIDQISELNWNSVIDMNLSSHWKVMKAVTPYLKLGLDPCIIVMGSKNVPAPGPGVAAYSAAKAGLTQLARVAALELAPFGIRVNTIHPDAVFDTGIWNQEVISNRAKHYGLTVEQYKRKNLLKTEITSKNVAQLVSALIGPAFAKTTGAQIPIDGGNDRVI